MSSEKQTIENATSADDAIAGTSGTETYVSKRKMIQTVSLNVSGILVSDEAAAKAAQSLSFAYIKRAPAKLINVLLLEILGETKIRNMDPHNIDDMTRDAIRNVQKIVSELLNTEVSVVEKTLKNLRNALNKKQRQEKEKRWIAKCHTSSSTPSSLDKKVLKAIGAIKTEGSTSRLKTRRPVSTPSAAAAAAAPPTESSSINVIPTQPQLPLRRSSRKAHCSYPIPKTKRKMKTPAKTLAASSAGAPTKSIASASSISAARKHHPSGPSSVSKRSLEFGNKTQPHSPKQLEQYNELFSSTKWQDINELICEETGEKTKPVLITPDHADLPEVSLSNASVEAPMKETEPELQDEDSLLDFIDCKPELREESSGVNFSDISLDGVDFGSASG